MSKHHQTQSNHPGNEGVDKITNQKSSELIENEDIVKNKPTIKGFFKYYAICLVIGILIVLYDADGVKENINLVTAFLAPTVGAAIGYSYFWLKYKSALKKVRALTKKA